jgi:hypothetical protein
MPPPLPSSRASPAHPPLPPSSRPLCPLPLRPSLSQVSFLLYLSVTESVSPTLWSFVSKGFKDPPFFINSFIFSPSYPGYLLKVALWYVQDGRAPTITGLGRFRVGECRLERRALQPSWLIQATVPQPFPFMVASAQDLEATSNLAEVGPGHLHLACTSGKRKECCRGSSTTFCMWMLAWTVARHSLSQLYIWIHGHLGVYDEF